MGLSVAAPTETRLVVADDTRSTASCVRGTLSSLPQIDLVGGTAMNGRDAQRQLHAMNLLCETRATLYRRSYFAFIRFLQLQRSTKRRDNVDDDADTN